MPLSLRADLAAHLSADTTPSQSKVLTLQTPVSVKSITDYHNFVPPDKAICIGNIQSKVGHSALPVLCRLRACFAQ